MNSQPAPPRVLIVDDDPAHRLLCRIAVVAHGGLEVVGEAVDGDDGIEQARALQPDLIVLDLNMPNRSGIEALPDIRAAAPNAHVVVWSSDGPAALDEARAAGAAGAVAKRATADVLVATLVALAAR